MYLNRVRAAALGVQAPDKILRARGQNRKLKMCCGRTSCTVQSATPPVAVRQM